MIETFKDTLSRMANDYYDRKVNLSSEMEIIKRMIEEAFRKRSFLIKVVPFEKSDLAKGYCVGYSKGCNYYELIVMPQNEGLERQIYDALVNELRILGFNPYAKYPEVTVEW